MAMLVGEQFHMAMDSLTTGNQMLFQQVRDTGYQANIVKVEIDQMCTSALGNYPSDVGDLKWVLTVLKITTEFERISYQTALLVRRAEGLIQQGKITHPLCSKHIIHCASLALDLINKTMKAFTFSDVNIATQVILHNKELNEEYDFITRSLVDHLLKEPRSISMTLDVLFMAKIIERIGENAKSISEYVILLVNSREASHSSDDSDSANKVASERTELEV
jgi:phosphate transport system protein